VRKGTPAQAVRTRIGHSSSSGNHRGPDREVPVSVEASALASLCGRPPGCPLTPRRRHCGHHR
jgi:hypothetical protein